MGTRIVFMYTVGTVLLGFMVAICVVLSKTNISLTGLLEQESLSCLLNLNYVQPKMSRFELVGYDYTSSPNCTHPACRLNDGRQPVKYTSNKPDHACTDVTSCVTVITRTRHRMTLVLKQIESVQRYYPKIKIVVVDDLYLTDKKLDKIWLDWLDKQNINDVTYVQTRTGLSYGRNIALRLVTTPYFFLTDDDFVFTKETNLFQLMKVLENTDLSIVATEVDKYPFEGIMRVVQTDGTEKPKVEFHTGLAYENVPCFPQCYVMDNVKNCFMGKTEDIFKAGAWDSWKNFFEHEDFLMRMRIAGLKLAKCPDVTIKHLGGGALGRIRMKFYQTYWKLLLKQWDLADFCFCDDKSYSVKYGCEKPRPK